MQREFVDASLAAEQAEQRKETQRRRNLTILAFSMAFLATVSSYLFIDSQQKANDLAAALEVAQRNESRALTAFAEQQITRLNHTTARNLALAALPISLVNPDRAFVPEALAALYRAVYHGRELAVLDGHQGAVGSAVFDPAGALVLTASADDQTARLWDAASGDQLAVLDGHRGAVWSAVFDPAGALVLTASDDQTARLGDAASGDQLAVLDGHQGAVWSAVFDPAGALVLTASDDQTARLWRVLPYWGEALIEHARATLPRELTERERQLFYLPIAE